MKNISILLLALFATSSFAAETAAPKPAAAASKPAAAASKPAEAAKPAAAASKPAEAAKPAACDAAKDKDCKQVKK